MGLMAPPPNTPLISVIAKCRVKRSSRYTLR